MSSEQQEYASGQYIFREGEPGEFAYILESGSVEMSKVHKGRVQVTEILREGIFGLLPLVDNKPRQFSAKARTHVVVTPVCRDSFAKRMTKSDPVVQAVVHLLTKSFREATDRLSTGGELDASRGDLD